jgi:hypothetical protein
MELFRAMAVTYTVRKTVSNARPAVPTPHVFWTMKGTLNVPWPLYRRQTLRPNDFYVCVPRFSPRCAPKIRIGLA